MSLRNGKIPEWIGSERDVRHEFENTVSSPVSKRVLVIIVPNVGFHRFLKIVAVFLNHGAFYFLPTPFSFFISLILLCLIHSHIMAIRKLEAISTTAPTSRTELRKTRLLQAKPLQQPAPSIAPNVSSQERSSPPSSPSSFNLAPPPPPTQSTTVVLSTLLQATKIISGGGGFKTKLKSLTNFRMAIIRERAAWRDREARLSQEYERTASDASLEGLVGLPAVVNRLSTEMRQLSKFSFLCTAYRGQISLINEVPISHHDLPTITEEEEDDN